MFESNRLEVVPGGNRMAIWTITSDGKRVHPVTDPALFNASHPEWSRQQMQIVLAAEGKGIGIIEI